MRRPAFAPLSLAVLVLVATVATSAPLAAASAGSAAARTATTTAAPGTRLTDRVMRPIGSGHHAAGRPGRHVDVGSLPKPKPDRHIYQPRLHSAPVVSRDPKAPAPRDTTGDPPQATVSTVNPANLGISTAGADSALGVEPPDPSIAVGPDHVVQATNEAITITGRPVAPGVVWPLPDFFALPAGYQAETFDPHVIYDSVHGRWLASEAGFDCTPDSSISATVGTGFLDIAISDNADPNQGWSITSLIWADAVPDYPGMGTSTDKIVLSSNLYDLVNGSGTFGCDLANTPAFGTELDVVSWADLIGPSSNIPFVYFTDVGAPPNYPQGYFTFRPAVQVPATSATVFGVAQHVGAGNAVTAFRITGLPSTNNVALSRSDTGLFAFADPPAPSQPGTPATIVDAVDARPTDAIWQANKLVFVSTYPCVPTGGVLRNRDCVRVSALNMTPTATTVAQDFLIAEPGKDLYTGGIGLSGSSDLHVVWTMSSLNAPDYPSTYTAYQRAGAAVNTLAGKQRIAAGSGTYPGTRWGDYNVLAQDPQVPDAVWQADEFSTGPMYWSTHVNQLRTDLGSSYVPIPPVRVLNSVKFTAGTPQTFPVAGFSVGGLVKIPANAVAITGNVTVVHQTAAGYVSVTPYPTTKPPSSTINFPLGDIRANNITMSLSRTGTLSAVYMALTGKTTDIIVDVTGYFLPNATNNRYFPQTPIRLLNTQHFQAEVPQEFLVGGVLGIPTTAVAITGNLTVVHQTKAGYVSITPNPTATPPNSTINFPLGDVRANGFTAPLNASHKLSIVYKAVAGGTVDVILDVTGWYQPAAVTGGLLFHPLNPGRILDTRTGIALSGLHGPFGSNAARTLATVGHFGVPAGVQAITGNLTIVNQTQAGYVADTPLPTTTPPTSTINFPLGDVRANGITAPLGGGNQSLIYKAGGGQTVNIILDVSGYFK